MGLWFSGGVGGEFWGRFGLYAGDLHDGRYPGEPGMGGRAEGDARGGDNLDYGGDIDVGVHGIFGDD